MIDAKYSVLGFHSFGQSLDTLPLLHLDAFGLCHERSAPILNLPRPVTKARPNHVGSWPAGAVFWRAC
jgi:hypothetical protein